MKFIETHIFTEKLLRYLTDEEYLTLQASLLLHPSQGKVIPGTGGLRKLRFGTRGKGKRGGLRVIYYWHVEEKTIYLLLVYAKSTSEDLSPDQIRILARLVREELK
jgi:mRNA-degrading endonuclease RelE of RelBE toxin-antitoxin system